MYSANMRKVEGSAGVQLLECINPAKNKWRVRWDVRESGDSRVTYMEHDFDHKPSPDEVKGLVLSWYNAAIDKEILSVFVWNGMRVWLSSENQFNYKASYDLAVQSGKNLPVTFKFGSDEEPVYHEFTGLEELSDFYTRAMKHIQDTLASGWKRKDAFDSGLYL